MVFHTLCPSGCMPSLPVPVSAHAAQHLCAGLNFPFATTSSTVFKYGPGPTVTVFKDVTEVAPSLSCEVAQFKEKSFPK